MHVCYPITYISHTYKCHNIDTHEWPVYNGYNPNTAQCNKPVPSKAVSRLVLTPGWGVLGTEHGGN